MKILGLPPDCPVTALGGSGKTYHLIDALGQGRDIKSSEFSEAKIQSLFGRHQDYLARVWPGEGGFSAIDCAIDLKAACNNYQSDEGFAPDVIEPGVKLGDVVKLKSGGHMMTVVSDDCCREVDVVWSENGQMHHDSFFRECLEIVENPEDDPSF